MCIRFRFSGSRTLTPVACAAALLLLTASAAHAAKTRVLLVLGDSLSDQENTAIQTNKTVSTVDPSPNPELYYDGRYTNAPGNWVDFIEDVNATEISVRNFAYGGSAACSWEKYWSDVTSLQAIPSLKTQFDKLQAKFNETGYVERLIGTNRPLFGFVWSGLVDTLLLTDVLDEGDIAALPDRVAGCLQEVGQRLLADPNIKFLILGTVIPLDQTPLAKSNGKADAYATAVTGINARINQLADLLRQRYSPGGATVLVWDAHAALSDVVARYEQLGFTTLDPCLDGTQVADGLGAGSGTVCTTPDEHVWYDQLFPSSAVHKLVYEDLYKLLGNSGLLNVTGAPPVNNTTPPVVPVDPGSPSPSPSPAEGSPSPSPEPSPSQDDGSPSPSPDDGESPSPAPAGVPSPSPDDHGGHGGDRDDNDDDNNDDNNDDHDDDDDHHGQFWDDLLGWLPFIGRRMLGVRHL